MTRLKSRLNRVDAAAGPHLGQRIQHAYDAALRTLHDDELQRLIELLDVDPSSGQYDEIQERANELAEGVAAGSVEWHKAFTAIPWPEAGYKAQRHEWAKAPFVEPPRVPHGGLHGLLQDARSAPAGLERDAHLVAYTALAVMRDLGESIPRATGRPNRRG